MSTKTHATIEDLYKVEGKAELVNGEICLDVTNCRPFVASMTSGCLCWPPSASLEARRPRTQAWHRPPAGDLFSPAAIGVLGCCTPGQRYPARVFTVAGPVTNTLTPVKLSVLTTLPSMSRSLARFMKGCWSTRRIFCPPTIRSSSPLPRVTNALLLALITLPDDLGQPLIKHSLDYLIAEKLQEPDAEKALLSLRVADIACGSGTSCSLPLDALPQSWPSSAPARSNPRLLPSAPPCAT